MALVDAWAEKRVRLGDVGANCGSVCVPRSALDSVCTRGGAATCRTRAAGRGDNAPDPARTWPRAGDLLLGNGPLLSGAEGRVEPRSGREGRRVRALANGVAAAPTSPRCTWWLHMCGTVRTRVAIGGSTSPRQGHRVRVTSAGRSDFRPPHHHPQTAHVHNARARSPPTALAGCGVDGLCPAGFQTNCGACLWSHSVTAAIPWPLAHAMRPQGSIQASVPRPLIPGCDM